MTHRDSSKRHCPSCLRWKALGHFKYYDGTAWVEMSKCKACHKPQRKIT